MNIPTNAEIRQEAWTRLKEYGVLKAIGVLLLTILMIWAVMLAVIFGASGTGYFKAAENIAGNTGSLTVGQIVTMTMFIVQIIFSCLCILMGIGIVSYFIKIARGQEAGFTDVFNGFKRNVVSNILIPLGYVVVLLPVIVLMIACPLLIQAVGFEDSFTGNLLVFVTFAVFFIYYIVVLVKYAFVVHIAGDMNNVQTYAMPTMFKLCKKITRGNKGRIFKMCLMFCLYGFCIWLVFLIGTILVATVGEAVDVDAVRIILVIVLYLAYLIGCFVLGVYTNVCFALLYVKLIDNYFGVKEPEINTDMDIEQLIAMYDGPGGTEEQQEI